MHLRSASCFRPVRTALGVVVLAAVLTSVGCTTSGSGSPGRTRNFATTATATAAGAYIGAREGDGKARNAALGAAVGFVAGETINYFSDKAQREAYLAGYEKGQSDAVKQQYWIARDNQRRRDEPDDGYEEALYEIPVPASERDGVRREATTRVIRIVLPREES